MFVKELFIYILFIFIDSALSLDETTEEILDEDEVLGVSVLLKCNNNNNNINILDNI